MKYLIRLSLVVSAALFILAAMPALAVNPIQFATPIATYPANNSNFVISADMDGDGKLDLIYGSGSGSGPFYVDILWGKGDGTFSGPTAIPVPNRVYVGAAGDLFGNGRMDIAAVSAPSNAVYTIKNNGSRSFTYEESYVTGQQPYDLCLADFNEDGFTDIAASNNDSNTITVFFNDGSGGFAKTSTLSTGQYPEGIVAADFNNDGHMDIADSNEVSGTAGIYLGDGKGEFTKPTYYTIGDYGAACRVGDFANNGILDIVTGLAFSDDVSVLLGNGKGQFGTATMYPTGGEQHDVGIGDFDGDGNLDLAVPNSELRILRGNGDGTFETAVDFDIPNNQNLRAITVGDFNGDGQPDIAIADDAANTIYVLVNDTNPSVSELNDLSFSPQVVVGGNQTTLTISLNGPAPTNGAEVSLRAQPKQIISLPSSVTITAPNTSISIPIATNAVTKNAVVNVTATYLGVPKATHLRVTPVGVSALRVLPNTVSGTQPAVGEVLLNAPATGTGLVVNLTSSSAKASVPATVTVPPGKSDATFVIKTTNVTTNTVATIQAMGGARKASATLTITPY